MRLYRAYCEGPLVPGRTLELSEEESRHLGQVRRVAPGHPLVLVNGAGAQADGELEDLRKRVAVVRVQALQIEQPAPTPRILAAALTKSTHFDEMLQRAVELGMTAFLPLMTERTVIELDDRRVSNRQERWRRVMIEALKQCERLWLPAVLEPMGLDQAVEWMTAQGVRPLAMIERTTAPGPEHAAAGATQGVAVVVGPEGGWSPAEAEFLAQRAVATSLGTEAILRAETACLAALARLAAVTPAEPSAP